MSNTFVMQSVADENVVVLPFRAPFDWDSLVRFLGTRAIPRVEEVVDGEYRRTFAIGSASGVVRVAPGGGNALSVEAPTAAFPQIVERVRRMFDLDAQPERIAERFSDDALLGPLVMRWPGIRVPGIWEPFEAAMRAVVGQQISVAGARTILGRIAAKYGTRIEGHDALDVVFPDAARLARARVGGMPATRSATIRALACAFANGTPALGVVSSVRGVGPWTSSYLALRAYGDRDAFPAGDLGLRKAAGGISARELEEISDRWRPYRAYAAILLWRSL